LTWLIAEDEADIRNLLAMMCQVWGYKALTFENGQRAWDWLDSVEQGQQSDLPELILMDIRMPGKKGNEIAQRARTIAALQKTPIVLMTAFSLSERERSDMMTEDGVDHILSKPLPDFEELRTLLTNVIQQKKEQARPQVQPLNLQPSENDAHDEPSPVPEPQPKADSSPDKPAAPPR
jgi:CheY-like chemotaxis protein